MFSNFKKEVECLLCLDIVKEFKMFLCLYLFCLECFDKYVGYVRRWWEMMIKCLVCLIDFNILKSDMFFDLFMLFYFNWLVDILVLRDDSV